MADPNFSELAQTLWKTCTDNGVAAWLRPSQIRREAYARADAKRIEAQGDHDAAQIVSGVKTLDDFQLARRRKIAVLERRLEPELDLEALPAIVQELNANELMRKEVNVGKALLQAEEELQQDSSRAPDSTVDGDWIRRWRDIVGNVSNENLQSLWGRLLAGEVKSPGKHSLRTLDIIRNISSEDAQLILKLAPYSIHGFIWREPGVGVTTSSSGLTFSDLLYFEEIGILSGATSPLSNKWVSKNGKPLQINVIVGNYGIRALHLGGNAEIEIRGMMLTRAGAQILDLCEFEADLDYLRELGARFKAADCETKLFQVLEDTPDAYNITILEDL